MCSFREPPNLDLPEEPSEPLPIEDIPLPCPPKEKKEKQEGGRFKEKRVQSLASGNDNTKVTFKKRKLGSGARNTRQREDDDWQRVFIVASSEVWTSDKNIVMLFDNTCIYIGMKFIIYIFVKEELQF